MTTRRRPAFTLFQLLVLLALLALLLGLLLPLIAKVRAQAARTRSLNNLRQLALACHNYHDASGAFPPGNDAKNFSATARLLPYVEQANLYNLIDFNKPMDDPANARARAAQVKVLLSPNDPQATVVNGWGATNYLFSAGTKASLKDNNGVFYQDSKTKLPDITDGTSNTLMIGETLKGDGGTGAPNLKRDYVRLKAEALKGLEDESGVEDFKENKHVAHDRCASWLDGRFLQGTYTGTRLPNDARPDVDCGGAGGLSALRSLDDQVAIALCDGSVRLIQARKMKAETWKALTTRNGGEVIPEF
jgi:type II secretory pathway pseudopilin PulG